MNGYDFGSILFALFITIAFYCAFPLLSANYCKTPKNKKKYILTCYGVNLIGWIGLFVLTELSTGRTSSGGAYILWTGVFSAIGIKSLDKRGMLIQDENDITKTSVKIKSVLNCESREERIAYFEEQYQEESERKLNKILAGDYTEEAKTAVHNILVRRKERYIEQPNANELSSIVVSKTDISNIADQQSVSNIRFCRKCGNELPPDSKFCNKCGLKLE